MDLFQVTGTPHCAFFQPTNPLSEISYTQTHSIQYNAILSSNVYTCFVDTLLNINESLYRWNEEKNSKIEFHWKFTFGLNFCWKCRSLQSLVNTANKHFMLLPKTTFINNIIGTPNARTLGIIPTTNITSRVCCAAYSRLNYLVLSKRLYIVWTRK